MNVVLVNPVSSTPAYTIRDFVFRPSVPSLTTDPRALHETNHVELGAELSRRGFRVTVVFGDLYMDGREHALSDRLKVVPVPTHLRVPFHPGLVPVTPGLVRHPALRDADVIQASEFHQPSTFFAALAARERGIPLVVWQETFRRMRFPGSLYQLAFESSVGPYVRSARGRFVPRTTRARSFLRRLRVEPGAITDWIPTGIDTRAYAPRPNGGHPDKFGWGEDAQILLLVARLHPAKGIDLALRTLKWLLRRQPNVRLAIRGSGPQLERLRRLAAELGVDHAVRFLGRLTREDMVELYNAAELVLCTSENDLLPFTLMEAGACGRPSVVADVGAVRDIVVDGTTGVVVEERTPEAFGGTILSLLRDGDRRRALGREARARTEQHFALPVVADRLTEVYRRAAS